MLNSNSKKHSEHAAKKKALLAKKGKATPGLTRESEPVVVVKEDQPLATVTELPKIVEESKAALHAEEQSQLPRKRGRPPGSKTKQPESETPPPPPADPLAALPPPQDDSASLRPIIADSLTMYYDARAEETGWEGYRIKPEKADMLAMQVDMCAEKYFPQLSEKSSLLVVTLLSVGMHVLGTEIGYKRWKVKQQAKLPPKPEVVEKKIQEDLTRPPIPAQSFFQPGA